ncbi:hypothetical protein HPB47_022943, partial [Ixodes persulcatus]
MDHMSSPVRAFALVGAELGACASLCCDEFMGVLEPLEARGEAFEVGRVFQRLSTDMTVRSIFGTQTHQQLGREGMDVVRRELRIFIDSLVSDWQTVIVDCFPEFSFVWRCILVLRSHFMKTPADKVDEAILPAVHLRRSSPTVESYVETILRIEYLDQVTLEALRLYPPVTGGMTILIPVHQLHHDLNLWNQPEAFDPDRFSACNKSILNSVQYQAFGNGPRRCMGMRFAQLELKIAFAKILANYSLFLDERHIRLIVVCMAASIHAEDSLLGSGPGAYRGAGYADSAYPSVPFSFGYDTVDEFGTKLFHKEDADASNSRTGSYGYTDPNGLFRRVNYVADAGGFRATVETNEPGTAPGQSADAVFNANPVVSGPGAKGPWRLRGIGVRHGCWSRIRIRRE